MSKKVIECEYCHSLISEDDVKCPECGANCSNAIKKYRQEQAKIEKEKELEEKNKQEEALKAFNSVGKGFRFFFLIPVIFFIIILVIAITQIHDFGKKKDNVWESTWNTDDNTEDPTTPPEEEKDIVVGYNEIAEVKDMKVILDSYELYEYHSNDFESFNTPKGYQKIAFHFTIDNLGKNDLSTYSLIDLTADDSKVETCKQEISVGFDKVVKGKEKYEPINNSYIGSERP